ncbi:putative oxygen-independent coproporphyrinogen III oxidase [Rhizopus microsporus var. microsporus]|uniref:Radical S-adenosyl methionine domain-containing protein 1, mitochondrial n=1 Tax=Rhizopus microsporus var. microsporus TaxID=86635 RepID=A0A1X0R0E9_RHIZD|nr:putative oxygen-independent coproporphyrinogen III oxidase [Rhizopus microsporus var. microsporus]
MRNSKLFSVYIHWPFCESKCTYCNFNKYVNPRDPPHERLLAAMKTELGYFLNNTRFQLKHKKIHSVYFGGGTPSLAQPVVVSSLLSTLDKHIGLTKETEITLEANPTSAEKDKLEQFKQIGINRLSLGIQTFNQKHLKMLGRDHSAKEALSALEAAKRIFGSDRVSFDLIFARPGQTLDEWKNELKDALTIAGDHLSLYQLSMERSTPLHKQYLKGLVPAMPDHDLSADMYEETVRQCEAFGYSHYEVSSFAKTQKAISRHNFSYWQGIDYLGIGPGAHGRLTDVSENQRVRTFGEFHPDKYMALCESDGEGLRKIIPIPFDTMAEELIVFGLRTRMGIPRSRFRELTGGKSVEEFLNKEQLNMFLKAEHTPIFLMNFYHNGKMEEAYGPQRQVLKE